MRKNVVNRFISELFDLSISKLNSTKTPTGLKCLLPTLVKTVYNSDKSSKKIIEFV
ncbi:hypothetical protein LEP1GSC192_2529 [Leptospira sp. B5-022]|nr:hypothetical protein LEP1GSC192_2529 [Leptospira sp. B5-022]